MSNYSIAILGMGAVGGYIGGKLAAAHIPGLRVVFIARGETLLALKRDGLKLIAEDGEAIVRPDLVSDDPEEIGPVDLLICAVKGYDLRESLSKYRACLTTKTEVLPLLNGIGIADKVRAIIPGTDSWEGLIYVVARQIAKGVVQQTGTLREVIFGSPTAPRPALEKAAAYFHAAGLKATVPENIELELWRKFLFISVMATLTCYYRAPIGEIRRDAEKAADIPRLVHELQAVAVANGIPITERHLAAVLERIGGLPAGTTTSMYADYQKGGHTEVEELTGDVVRLGEKLGVPTPAYARMYAGLV